MYSNRTNSSQILMIDDEIIDLMEVDQEIAFSNFCETVWYGQLSV